MSRSVSRRAAMAQIMGGAALAGCAGAQASKLVGGAAAQTGGTSGADVAPKGDVEGVFDLYIANHRPMALMSSGGGVPVPVLFDTGSNGNMINKQIFDQFGLSRLPNHKSFITDAEGHTIETYAARVPDMQLGSIRLPEPVMDVTDYRDGDECGIIGPALFEGSLVFMNMPKQSVYVRRGTAEPMPVPNAMPYSGKPGDGLPVMSISVEGVSGEMSAIIDTGKDGALQFPEEMIDSLPLVAPPRQVGTATTVFKTVPVYGATIDGDVKIGSRTLHRPDVIFHGDRPKVGMPVLESQRFWLEPHRQRAWVASERALPEEMAVSLAGEFGERRITADENGLSYQREGAERKRLKYLGVDQFLFEDGTDLIFRRDPSGAISGYTLLGSDGRPTEVMKTS